MGEIKAFGENVSFYLVINWFTFLLYPALHYKQIVESWFLVYQNDPDPTCQAVSD